MNILENAIRALGIEPDQFRAMLVGITDDFKSMKANMDAARGGFTNAVQHYELRMRAVETSQVLIMASLARIETVLGLEDIAKAELLEFMGDDNDERQIEPEHGQLNGRGRKADA